MRALLILAFVFLPVAVLAGAYKWVGSDGTVHYSNHPVSGAEPVKIQVDTSQEVSEGETRAGRSNFDYGPYNRFEIVNPQPNETLRDAEGNVMLGLLIEPPLSEDHRLQILLNDQPLPGEGEGLGSQIQLRGLTFGSHRIQACIRDDLDEIVASTPVIDFHLLKPVP